MAYILRSQSDPTLYMNGAILDGKRVLITPFSPITNARQFETIAEAQTAMEESLVPMTIVEV